MSQNYYPFPHYAYCHFHRPCPPGCRNWIVVKPSHSNSVAHFKHLHPELESDRNIFIVEGDILRRVYNGLNIIAPSIVVQNIITYHDTEMQNPERNPNLYYAFDDYPFPYYMYSQFHQFCPPERRSWIIVKPSDSSSVTEFDQRHPELVPDDNILVLEGNRLKQVSTGGTAPVHINIIRNLRLQFANETQTPETNPDF